MNNPSWHHNTIDPSTVTFRVNREGDRITSFSLTGETPDGEAFCLSFPTAFAYGRASIQRTPDGTKIVFCHAGISETEIEAGHPPYTFAGGIFEVNIPAGDAGEILDFIWSRGHYVGLPISADRLLGPGGSGFQLRLEQLPESHERH